MIDELATGLAAVSDGCVVLTVAGEIDMQTAPAFGIALEDALQTADQVDIDCADITFMDSSGIRELVRAHRRATERHKTVRLSNVSPSISRTLGMVGVDLLFGLGPAPVREPAIDTSADASLKSCVDCDAPTSHHRCDSCQLIINTHIAQRLGTTMRRITG